MDPFYKGSEIEALVKLFQRLGIDYFRQSKASPEPWQGALEKSSFNGLITLEECWALREGGSEHLFASREIKWDGENTPPHPRGLHLMTRAMDTGKIEERRYYDGKIFWKNLVGLAALKKQYGEKPQLEPAPVDERAPLRAFD